MSTHSLVYVTFDRFPAPKGASTHIQAFIAALTPIFSQTDLVTVAGPTAPEAKPNPVITESDSKPIASPSPNFSHTQIPAIGGSLVERVLYFRSLLTAWWGKRRPRVAHFRSIYEGYPVARHKHTWCDKLVFEVNGLPSIELKYHYPQVADDRELMKKLLSQEACCLDAADLVITVSEVNAQHLRTRGVPAEKIRVIPNGVDIELFSYASPRPWVNRELRILYSGTLSSWQGVDTAIEALALYRREAPAQLTIVGYGRTGQAKRLLELAHRLEVAPYVDILDTTSQAVLSRLHHEADVVLAPLLANDRNITQGCCPLKVLEAMASGTPLIASDLPVVSALARPELDALLVRPGSAKAIKDALLRLRDDYSSARQRSETARQRVVQEFTWEKAQRQLVEAYQALL